MFLPVAIWVLTMLDSTLTQTLASSIKQSPIGVKVHLNSNWSVVFPIGLCCSTPLISFGNKMKEYSIHYRHSGLSVSEHLNFFCFVFLFVFCFQSFSFKNYFVILQHKVYFFILPKNESTVFILRVWLSLVCACVWLYSLIFRFGER